MGKFLVILVGIISIVASTMLHSTKTNTVEAEQRLNEHTAKVLAREVALTGLGEGTQLVFDSFEASGSYTGPLTLTGLHDGGSYQLDINTSGTDITVKAVGTFNRARHTLSRSYSYLQSGGGSVPPFMGRPVTCNGNLVVQDDFNLSDASEDVNVHANGNVRFAGGNALITGFGTYGGNLELENGQSESDIFHPNSGGTPLTEQVDDIDIPVFMPEAYEGIATVADYDNVMLSGTVALGTKANPKIWYIDGNLMMTGPVTFTGYGVFVVNGDIEINNDVTTAGASEESTVGFYTRGNITIKNSGLDMAGQWILKGNVELESNTRFTGTITNTGNCYFKKSFNMSYRSASPALTEPFWPSGGGGQTPGTLILAGAQEW